MRRKASPTLLISKSVICDENTAFLNRALVCEHQLATPEGHAPLDEYPVFSSCVSSTDPDPPLPPAPPLKLSELFTEPKGKVRTLEDIAGPEIEDNPRPAFKVTISTELKAFFLDLEESQAPPASSSDTPADEIVTAPAAGIPYPWPSGYYFGDGSGGEYTKYPTLRRAGVGIYHVSPDKTLCTMLGRLCQAKTNSR